MTANFASSPSLTIEEVGQRFLSYYRELGYQELPSSSLLTDSLPMTFVMSAGMVQFELLADQARESDRFALIQRCFRHFDIEEAGKSEAHLSLFHMPGAFRFGKIDRRRVVEEIWRLLTDVYGFNPENMAVTYFVGGEIENTYLPEDQATAHVWEEVGMKPHQIFGMPAESNYWRQSAHMVGIVNSRKCGPNTEVFYDRGERYSCGANCKPGCPCGRFIEFSNTLFIEKYVDENGTLHSLDEPFTEVVIGQERVGMLLQKLSSVYEIETVAPLVQQVRCFSVSGMLSEMEIRHYEHIIADHLRSLIFLIKDGTPPPGRGGRARLIRILVRELLTAKEILGITDPAFLRSMLYVAADLYPETTSAHQRARRYIAEEEIRFQETLRKGLERLNRQIEKGEEIGEKTALDYQKRYGIPLSLLNSHLQQKGIFILHSR